MSNKKYICVNLMLLNEKHPIIHEKYWCNPVYSPLLQTATKRKNS